MISKQTIDEILSVAKIEEVVGDFVQLRRRGQSWVGLCPFHNDKSPSMYVTPRLGIYKCFVCDAGGDSVRFLMEHEKMSYPEALRYIAAKYNIPIVEDDTQSPEESAEQKERESMFAINEFAANYFSEQLFNTEEGQNIGMSYFQERGFQESTIKKFRLGYNPSGWDSFVTEALKQGYKLEYLEQLGLVKKSEKTGKPFDFYHDRVIFPIHTKTGKIVGFGGRVLQKDAKGMKYVNSPENLIYHKRENLYGFYFAKNAIKRLDNVYLVEGYTDVLSMQEAGVENVVAASGTALPDEQIKLISLYTKNITLVNDGDKAGINASLRDIGNLLNKGLNVKVVLLPDGEDPDSFAKKHRDSELQEYLHEQATDFILFKIKILSKEAGNDPIKRAEMVKTIIEDIAALPDPIVQAFYIKECSELFSLSEEMLNLQLRKLVWKKLNKPTPGNGPTQPEAETLPIIKDNTQKNTISQASHEERMRSTEEDLLLLLVQYGLSEIVIGTPNANGSTTKANMRLDSFIFKEFEDDQLTLTTPFCKLIFDEYQEIAQNETEQDAIIKHFISHPTPEIQNFFIRHLMKEMPTYSENWKERFDIVTHSVDNSLQKRQNEVENIINNYKLCLLDNYSRILDKELKEEHPDEIIDQIMSKYQRVIACRKEIATLVGRVIIH